MAGVNQYGLSLIVTGQKSIPHAPKPRNVVLEVGATTIVLSEVCS